MRSSIQVLFLSFLFYGTYSQEAYKSSSQESTLEDIIGPMNATLVDIQRTIAVTAKCTLEPIQTAQAEEEGRRKPVRELTDRLLLNPRAKLYTGLNYTGDFELYEESAEKNGCYNFESVTRKFKSVNTEGTCVRIFEKGICMGWSQVIYPGSSAVIDPKLERVGSVGPCVRNEFEYATLTMSGNPPVLTVNKRAEEVTGFANVPDLVPDYWAYTSQEHSLNNAEPIISYKLGQGGRLEGVRSRIYLRHILSSDVAEGKRLAGLDQGFFPDLGMIPLTDEPGYVVPLELGGPAKEAYNVFAQDKRQAAKYRAFLVPIIKQYLAKNPDEFFDFDVALQYSDSASKRPAGIWYWAWKSGTDDITYGYFSTVHSVGAPRVVPAQA